MKTPPPSYMPENYNFFLYGFHELDGAVVVVRDVPVLAEEGVEPPPENGFTKQ